MSVLVWLVPMALVMGSVFAGLFVWAAQSGQLEDLDDPPLRMLEPEVRSERE